MGELMNGSILGCIWIHGCMDGCMGAWIVTGSKLHQFDASVNKIRFSKSKLS